MTNERGNEEKDRSKARTVIMEAVSAPTPARPGSPSRLPPRRQPPAPAKASSESARLAAKVLRTSSFQRSAPPPQSKPASPVATPPRALPALPRIDVAAQVQRQARLTGSVPIVPVVEKRPEPRELAVLVRTWTGDRPRPELAVTGSQLCPLAATRSRRGERSALALRAVLQQFAPACNPRYDKGERGHLFVWDVATAMECLVPRFTRIGECPLLVIASWFRTQSIGHQWHRVSTGRALELAGRGGLVVALPKARGLETMAILQPGEELRVSSACRRRRGMHLDLREALGVGAADFFFHE